MAHWLVKSEPAKYSWQQLVKDGRTHWNGVRNFQAANNLKAMRLGEQAFFYHSVEELAIVGIVENVREYYPDPTDATKSWFFLANISAATLYNTTGIPVLAHWLFQFAFADCASTICSGTMIGRTAFWGDILYSVCVSGFIYPIIGHWTWGPDGFLYTMGADGKFLSSLGIESIQRCMRRSRYAPG